MCLPRSYRNLESGNIPIPRTEKRYAIAEAGLIGKVEFGSDMSDLEVRQEICKVFAKPMGLIKTSIEQGEIFQFTYLRRTGPGSHTLCVPSVSGTFEWDGKKVSTLAKSSGIIYILADSYLPEFDEVMIIFSLPGLFPHTYFCSISLSYMHNIIVEANRGLCASLLNLSF